MIQANWNLDSLFEGGSHSNSLQQELSSLKNELEELKKKTSDLKSLILMMQAIEARHLEADCFITCLMAQNTDDQKAIQLSSQSQEIKTLIAQTWNPIKAQLKILSMQDLERLTSEPALKDIAFSIKEKYIEAQNCLSPDQENIIQALSSDGYAAWTNLYITLKGQLTLGELSVGQFENKLSHPDRSVRQNAFNQWVELWQSQERVYAHILNHLAGFRLQMYAQRGWNQVLKEPLFNNRMQEKTLQVMWEAIRKNQSAFLSFFSDKAALLGLHKLAWFDIEAPLPFEKQTSIPFEEAVSNIIEQFERFSPRMGNFAKMAWQNKWIEAEDRPKKLPGGFCSQHPVSRESRIFMTYSGSQVNVFTLAHELGHAYHNFITQDLPFFSQQYAMNVAETASTFAEMLLIDFAIKNSQDRREKASLLNNKLQRSVIFLMNIQARFLFETEFYERRKKGVLLPEELNALMEEAQKEAFGQALEVWHPHFWIAKGHFYNTCYPFYNFPYTFGYLFSLGIYARALQTQKFAHSYDALLLDTGRMTVEELAMKHLQADLTQPGFWQDAIDLIKEDIRTFTHLK
jgi:oligoendopeptidase F